jgi:hypothetical protein
MVFAHGAVPQRKSHHRLFATSHLSCPSCEGHVRCCLGLMSTYSTLSLSPYFTHSYGASACHSRLYTAPQICGTASTYAFLCHLLGALTDIHTTLMRYPQRDITARTYGCESWEDVIAERLVSHEFHSRSEQNGCIDALYYTTHSDVRATGIVNGIGNHFLNLCRKTLLQHLRYLAVTGGMGHLASVLVGVGVVCRVWDLMLNA